MPIEGLCVRSEDSTVPVADFRQGSPDVAEAVGVTVEAYKTLGFTPDEDRVTESLTTDFTALVELGYDGRLYAEPPREVSFDDLIAAADGKRPSGVEATYRWPSLWIPGTEKKSYKDEELNAAPEQAVARLALFNADDQTGVDPLLHFLKQPFDDKHREPGDQTQLEALEAAKTEFAEEHERSFLQALGHRAAALMVLMDRIRGIDHTSGEFVLNQGWAYLPNLGRREKVDGASVVGVVYSDVGPLGFGRVHGDAYRRGGVGVVVGQE